MLEIGEGVEACRLKQILPRLEEDRPVDAESLQLRPPRFAGPERSHQCDGCLLANDLGKELADQCFGREASTVLLADGEPKTVGCDAVRVRLPADIPVHLPVEAGREEIH